MWLLMWPVLGYAKRGELHVDVLISYQLYTDISGWMRYEKMCERFMRTLKTGNKTIQVLQQSHHWIWQSKSERELTGTEENCVKTTNGGSPAHICVPLKSHRWFTLLVTEHFNISTCGLDYSWRWLCFTDSPKSKISHLCSNHSEIV